MSTKTNEALVHKWIAAWRKGDLSSLDELFSSAYTVNGKLVSVEGVKQAVQLFHSALSDMAIEVNEMISAGDKVVVRWTVRGIQTGEFISVPPTGTLLKLTGINIYQIAEDKIVANHEQTNIPEVLAQLKRYQKESPEKGTP